MVPFGIVFGEFVFSARPAHSGRRFCSLSPPLPFVRVQPRTRRTLHSYGRGHVRTCHTALLLPRVTLTRGVLLSSPVVLYTPAAATHGVNVQCAHDCVRRRHRVRVVRTRERERVTGTPTPCRDRGAATTAIRCRTRRASTPRVSVCVYTYQGCFVKLISSGVLLLCLTIVVGISVRMARGVEIEK